MKDANRRTDSTRVQAHVYISAAENVKLNLDDGHGRRRGSLCVPAEGAAATRTLEPSRQDAALQKKKAGKQIVIILTQLSEVSGCSSSSSLS